MIIEINTATKLSIEILSEEVQSKNTKNERRWHADELFMVNIRLSYNWPDEIDLGCFCTIMAFRVKDKISA